MMVLKVLRIKDNDTNLKKPMKGGIPKDSQGQIWKTDYVWIQSILDGAELSQKLTVYL